MMKLNRTMLMGCAVVAALSFGCNRDEGVAKSGDTSTPAAGTAGTAADARASSDKAPMTLTGCLQKTDGITGGDYVLAQASTGKSTAPVGTSGSAEPNDAIGQRQLNAAERSYRLSGESDQLKDLVGHKITVSGTVADRGDLASGKRTDDKDAKSGHDISTSDLAKVDVMSVQDVSANCSNASGATPKR
jgi:hypothetical protein